MNVANDVWYWIEHIEEDFVKRNVPFSDRQVAYLIKKLRMLEPYLILKNPGNELYEHFADKMELKFLKEDFHQRYLLFDFIKHLVHETFIKGNDISKI